MKTKKFISKSIIFLLILGLLISGVFIVWISSLFGKSLPTEEGITSGNKEAEPVTTACGGPAEMIVLILGIDENEQTDAIRLVRVDFVERKIIVLSIPRDFWVPIPGFSDHGITEGRINAVYGYGEYYHVEGGGIASTANTIYSNYGVKVDHYVAIHFNNFEKVIDKIGGVDIVLDKPVDANYIAGKYHLTGKTAMEFVRIREVDTDDYRIDRQTLVMTQVLKKIKDTLNAVQLVSLGIEVVIDKTILTDINIKDLNSLACLGKSTDYENIVFINIPQDMFKPYTTTGGANVRIPEPSVVPFIQKVLKGEIDQ